MQRTIMTCLSDEPRQGPLNPHAPRNSNKPSVKTPPPKTPPPVDPTPTSVSPGLSRPAPGTPHTSPRHNSSNETPPLNTLPLPANPTPISAGLGLSHTSPVTPPASLVPPDQAPRSALESSLVEAINDEENQLKKRIELLEQENKRLKAELEKETGQAEGQTNQRDVQLEGLREHLNPDDKAAMSDVIELVNKVNNLVEQLAFDVTKKFRPTSTPKPPGSTLAEKSPILPQILDQPLILVLDGCNPALQVRSVPKLVRHAIQAAALFEIVKLCDVDLARRIDNTAKDVLRSVTKNIQAQEIQPVYGHWRVLTHKHSRTKETPEALDRKTKDFASRLLSGFADILGSARGALLTTEEKKSALSEFYPSVREIYEQATRLSVMINEEVVSTDYILFLPGAGRRFSMKGMKLPGQAPDGNFIIRDTVVCTIKLGLIARGKTGRERVEVKDWYRMKAEIFSEKDMMKAGFPSLRSLERK